MRGVIPVVTMLILLVLPACSGGGGEADEGPLPTAAPTIAVEDEASTASAGSPRVTPGTVDSGVPPTWTPQPPPPTPQPFGTAAPAFRPAPGQAASQGEVYEVVEGDTLAEIAIRFGVELETLAAANGIEDVDHVEVGQRLVIPISGQ